MSVIHTKNWIKDRIGSKILSTKRVKKVKIQLCILILLWENEFLTLNYHLAQNIDKKKILFKVNVKFSYTK